MAFHLCGRHHQPDQEAEPEGVAVNSETASSVEGGEGDEDPSTPPLETTRLLTTLPPM